jgi:hypothetical protein
MIEQPQDQQAGAKPGARRSDEASWAKPVDRLLLPTAPAGAINLNVSGRKLIGPVQGFGPLWQKTYRIRLDGIGTSAVEVVKIWKLNYPRFWPQGDRFFVPPHGISPGEVGLINSRQVGGVDVATGVLVVYADDESFTFMNAAGHPVAAMITFSASDDADGTVAQVQVLIRPSDPFYDLMFKFYGSPQEDRIWRHTLRALAAHFGATGDVETTSACIDRRRRWSEAKNIWQNAAIRSGVYMALAPLRWLRGVGGRGRGTNGS